MFVVRLFTKHTHLIRVILQVYQRLAKLNVTVAHSSVIRLLDSIGNDFDKQVKDWRNGLLPLLSSSNVIVSIYN